MSEYIIDCTPKMQTDLREYRREPIVRCRDCASSPTGEWCNYWEEDTEPNGFCHKAIRRCEDVSIQA